MDGNRLLFQTAGSGFYFLDDTGFSKWEIPADDIVSNLSVYASQRLKDGSFILGTISKGFYQLDRSGSILNHIDQNAGLNNNTILSLYQDIDQNLWLGMDNGIALINTTSQYSFYKGFDENLGAVYASVIYNNNLYLGTNQGLYIKKNNSKERFQFVQGTEGQVWCLKVFDNTLFCGHDKGTYTIKDKTATLISDIPGTWDIKSIGKSNNILLQGHYNGMNVIEKINDDWKLRNKISGLNISSEQFEIYKDTLIYVNHEIEGLYKLTVNSDFTHIKRYSIENSLPKGSKSGLIKFDNNLMYATNEGIYEYDSNKGIFVKDTLLSQSLFKNDGYTSGTLIPNEHENTLWAFTNENVIRLVKGNLNNTMRPERLHISAKSRAFVNGYENMYQLDKQKYLFGTSNGYLILDLSKQDMSPDNFKISITAIENSVLDQKKIEIPLSGESQFKSDQNNLFFGYSVPLFDVFDEVYYQYKLEGIYDNWSEWTKSPEVSFTNLPFGKYTFKVKARIGTKLSDNIAFHTFAIERPWYLSNKMLAEYAILFFLLLGLIHYFYTRKFNRQKLNLLEEKRQEIVLSQLEAEKEIIQLKNEALQTEIESKRKELSATTINLIEKSEFLNNIKKELDHIRDDKELKPVIKILNKKLTNKNDWERFQEVFNNADSDFLKKIKTLHPSLTAHDLRICTFLRLNLSSKEIAALLNISPKSIEIKRFRLRKKLNLHHEDSLVSYILSI
ncbi:MAG: triple tyrosine motif-containing protein [Flavobacteriaceae bacterium]|nr:triple tyrosine motif-containing protein [Flavobacteriaceae bacterium]